ncbi:hypothetical protein C8R44DRAFT_733142 [Mycena epipterygia]|nr:hypothetical protein C8R44DRAFT_733142 [Mycena epipterygia]
MVLRVVCPCLCFLILSCSRCKSQPLPIGFRPGNFRGRGNEDTPGAWVVANAHSRDEDTVERGGSNVPCGLDGDVGYTRGPGRLPRRYLRNHLHDVVDREGGREGARMGRWGGWREEWAREGKTSRGRTPLSPPGWWPHPHRH